ncbi:hypothetical protein [Taibaiella soli]|uniref:Lipoprotein n=1 Tax=Taibaiella soli TaxID=1649169 RepID=A0A2W2BEH5_9BACT|nr:hypothetical protein [Taibaiella soli]PZF74659.1 hypothetical protein DN068_02035 [Taibaiella soli]
MNKRKPLAGVIAFSVIISCFTSCMTTKTNVGNYREAAGTNYTYSKGKQFWLFWGVLPVGRTNVNTPKDGNCQVVTRFNVGDVLITGVTAGIVSSYTIKVNAKK